MASLQTLTSIIQEYISDFMSKRNASCVVKPSIPVVWFGDMEAYERSSQKIVTIGLNPSLQEFIEPRFDMVDLTNVDAVEKLTQTLNSYFKKNPYNRWFRDFEKVLPFLDGSYYENHAKNTAIHIDIYSAIATDPTWGGLSNISKKMIQRTDLFKKLLNLLDPDIMIVAVNKEVFNDVFSHFKLKKGIEHIHGKKAFIRKYEQNNKLLISGINCRGQPFGNISNAEINEIMPQLLCENNDGIVLSNTSKQEKQVVVQPKSINKTNNQNKSEINLVEMGWAKSIELYISHCRGYACSGDKMKYLIAVLDILKTANKPMTIKEVQENCFDNYEKYDIDRAGKYGSKSNKTILYECLYQHSDYNHNKDTEKHDKFFTCFVSDANSKNNSYTLKPDLKL